MEYEIKPQGKLNLGIKELWEYRELFYFFTWRDIKIKYKQTVLGFLWAILQPLFMTLIFTLFLGRIISAGMPLPVPYPVFVLSGMVLWGIFSSGLSSAANSMVSNAHIIKKIFFPRLIIPISAILVALFDFFIALIIFFIVIFIYKTPLHLSALLYMPLAVFIAVTAAFGGGSLLAALNIKYRDFRYIVPFMIQALLFITPVIYPTTISGNPVLAWIMRLNPMTSAIELFRASFTGDYHFSFDFMCSFGMAVVLFIAGLFYFRKTEYYFADLA